MSKNKIQKVIATLFASALLISAGCSTSAQKKPNNTNDAVISPVNFQTEENQDTETDEITDEIPDDIFDDIKTVEIPEISKSVEKTENSGETSMSNSSVETSKPVSSPSSENKVTSNNKDKTETDNSENTISQPDSTPDKPTVQQNSNAPTTDKATTTDNTQNNTANKPQPTTKPSTNTQQNKEITSVSLDKSKVTLDVGETVKLNLTILPSDVTHKAYTFSTSDNRVAGIDINGVITAKADGTAQITVTTDNGKSAQCLVTVRKPDPTSVSINESSLKLSINDVYTLSASNNVNSESVKYSWSSSNDNCIKIISYNNKTIAVKAVGYGTATVTVKTQNNVTSSCRITVSKTDDSIKEIVRIVNNERANNGLPALANRIDLNELADIRAKEIVEKFAHTRPNGSSCFTILDNTHYMTAGENIAYGQTSASEVMTAWMNSQGHRTNILSSSFNCIGVGHCKANGIDYWVQIFIGE